MKLLKAILSQRGMIRERGGGGSRNFISLPFTSGGGGVIPHKRLMGMCCWMGLHFHDWSDYNGVAFSIELLE